VILTLSTQFYPLKLRKGKSRCYETGNRAVELRNISVSIIQSQLPNW